MKGKCRASFLNLKNVVENGNYVLKTTCQVSRIYIIFLLIQMLLGTAGPILISVLTKYLLDELGGSRGTRQLVLLVTAILVMGAGITALKSLLETKCTDLEILVNHRFDVLLQKKTAVMDYEFIESKEMQEKRELAKSGIQRMGGVSGYLDRKSVV